MIMREMKDSGVEWIGEIPESWKINLLSKVFNEHKLKNKELKEKNLLSLSYGRIVRKNINTLEGLLPESFNNYNIISKNDIVFRLTDLQNDKRSLRTGLCKEKGIITSAYVTIRNRFSDNASYFHYLFHSYDNCKVFYGLGDGVRQGMTYDDLKELKVLYPKVSEQQAIATYLDTKCTEIDELITLQETMISELQAYKQSVITEAVTKGLDKNVKLKDSGVEWIGEIPEHWDNTKIGRIIKSYKAGPFGSSLITGSLLHSGNILVYTPEHIANGNVNASNNLYLQDDRGCEMSQFKVNRGDIIFPIVGSLGRAMMITDSMPKGIINQRLARFKLLNHIDSDYFMWLFGKSTFYKTYIEINQRGSFIVNLTKEIVCRMPFPLPPVSEQQTIATYLDQKTTEIDSLITIKKQKIAELKEYKKSIIFEYVTGKKEVPAEYYKN